MSLGLLQGLGQGMQVAGKGMERRTEQQMKEQRLQRYRQQLQDREWAREDKREQQAFERTRGVMTDVTDDTGQLLGQRNQHTNEFTPFQRDGEGREDPMLKLRLEQLRSEIDSIREVHPEDRTPEQAQRLSRLLRVWDQSVGLAGTGSGEGAAPGPQIDPDEVSQVAEIVRQGQSNKDPLDELKITAPERMGSVEGLLTRMQEREEEQRRQQAATEREERQKQQAVSEAKQLLQDVEHNGLARTIGDGQFMPGGVSINRARDLARIADNKDMPKAVRDKALKLLRDNGYAL